MVRWVIGWLVVGALGLVAARAFVHPRQDTWLLVAAGRDDSVLVAQYGVGNTGVFAEQLTTRIAMLRADGAPLAHRAIAGPARFDERGVHGALDGVEAGADGAWELRVDGPAMRVRGRLRGATTGCPPEPGVLTGILDVPDPSASGEGSRLDAAAILVRTHSEGQPIASAALYAVDRAGALALDPLSDCPGFLALDGRAVVLPDSWIAPELDTDFDLTLGEHRVEVTAGRRTWSEDGFEGALAPEAWLARAVGYHEPDVTLQRVRVRVDTRPPWAGVLVVRRTSRRADPPG